MIWDREEDGKPSSNFLTAMHWACILGVTDARDRVYSLLGQPLAAVNNRPVIGPDYTVTRGVVYTNLSVVSLVDHEEKVSADATGRVWDPGEDGEMPSWVPDWHSILGGRQ